MRRFKKPFFALCGLALLALAGYWWLSGGEHRGARYQTAAVDRGDIRQGVTATGTINPVKVVNVGTQVSGIVKEINVDFNVQVKEGQLLARLDPSVTQAQLKQSQANLSSAQASLRLAQANFRRAQALVAKNYVARAELDQAAQQLSSARAQVTQTSAEVEQQVINLDYTNIRSPVSGVILSREVDVGQTVAASFQTPTLFKIAQDLKEMQITVNLSEADIGQIREGVPVTFTVDAYPDTSFQGVVGEVRLNPNTQQNLVNYNVIAKVKNDDLKLLPGMTAFVTILVAERKDAVRVPVAALRFKPQNTELLPAAPPPSDDKSIRTLYVLRDGKPIPLTVKTGVTDNRFMEITHGELRLGDQVITGMQAPHASGE